MSVLGIDVGNATSVVGLARRNGIDVVLNSESKRETPSMVNFAVKQARVAPASRARQTRSSWRALAARTLAFQPARVTQRGGCAEGVASLVASRAWTAAARCSASSASPRVRR